MCNRFNVPPIDIECQYECYGPKRDVEIQTVERDYIVLHPIL
jgi:hypothetical protein